MNMTPYTLNDDPLIMASLILVLVISIGFAYPRSLMYAYMASLAYLGWAGISLMLPV